MNRINGKRWKFGVGQTKKQEQEEIERAQLAGLELEYMDGQRLSRMIEDEREARRRGEHKARYYR